MTAQAHVVIKEYSLFQIIGIPHKSFVGVGVVAAPAIKILYVVDAFGELLFNGLKMILGIGFVISMTVHAEKGFFKP
jgi:hypothetical protein